MELRFALTSNVGHEQILTESDLESLIKVCWYNSKTVYKKLKPFYDVCSLDHKRK